MTSSNFEIIDKRFDGIHIIGFTVKDEDNNVRLISIDDAVRLAKSDKITNAKCILDVLNGDYILKIDGELPYSFKNSKIQLTIQCRILDSKGVCIGYKVIDNNGERYSLSIKKTWELAFNHSVVGVRALVINGKKTLKSVDGFKLMDIPKIQDKANQEVG